MNFTLITLLIMSSCLTSISMSFWGHAVHSISNTANSAANTLSNTANNAANTVVNYVSQTGSSVSDFTTNTIDQATTIVQTYLSNFSSSSLDAELQTALKAILLFANCTKSKSCKVCFPIKINSLSINTKGLISFN